MVRGAGSSDYPPLVCSIGHMSVQLGISCQLSFVCFTLFKAHGGLYALRSALAYHYVVIQSSVCKSYINTLCIT